jgi:hypothetical protein
MDRGLRSTTKNQGSSRHPDAHYTRSKLKKFTAWNALLSLVASFPCLDLHMITHNFWFGSWRHIEALNSNMGTNRNWFLDGLWSVELLTFLRENCLLQRVVAIPYRRFGTTYRSHRRCVITQYNAVRIYFAAEVWYHTSSILRSVTFSAALCLSPESKYKIVRSDIFKAVTVTVAVLLVRDAVWSGRWVPAFYRNLLSWTG